VIGRINPGAVITPYPAWATDQNLPEILAPAQVAVDCLDTLAARYLLEQAAKARGIPYIHAAVAGFEGVLMTVYPEDPGLAGLYGPDPAPKSMSAESFLGVPTAAPAILGGYQALETIHVLLGRRLMAKRRMVHFDLALAQVETCDLG
jgi:molybdopterin/thiamine biosynthesis adenylyltransferase